MNIQDSKNEYIYIVMQSGRTPRYAYYNGSNAKSKVKELNKLETLTKSGNKLNFEVLFVEIFDQKT